MKVILLKDLRNLGKKWEVKHVSEGYARNYLMPRGIVRLATQDALDELDEELRKREMVATEELEGEQSVAEQLDGTDVFVRVKADENGTVYGGVSAKTIQKALADMDYEVAESAIKIPSAIKEVGEYPITLEFEHGIEAQVRIIVGAEEEKK